jgi:hypothetical protein
MAVMRQGRRQKTKIVCNGRCAATGADAREGREAVQQTGGARPRHGSIGAEQLCVLALLDAYGQGVRDHAFGCFSARGLQLATDARDDQNLANGTQDRATGCEVWNGCGLCLGHEHRSRGPACVTDPGQAEAAYASKIELTAHGQELRACAIRGELRQNPRALDLRKA